MQSKKTATLIPMMAPFTRKTVATSLAVAVAASITAGSPQVAAAQTPPAPRAKVSRRAPASVTPAKTEKSGDESLKLDDETAPSTTKPAAVPAKKAAKRADDAGDELELDTKADAQSGGKPENKPENKLDTKADSNDSKTAAPATKAATGKPNDPNAIFDDPVIFHKLLGQMLTRTEKSIKLLREQIVQNQSAPFLADLFMQLGDLLSMKANVLYYQKIERDKDTNLKLSADEKANPIVLAEQEAIEVYKQILKEFPAYPKKDLVLYRLSVAHQAIDDGAAFVVTSEQLLKEYPKTKESFQVRLLLGQYYMDHQDFPSAQKSLLPNKDCPFPFERDSALHRLGLIAMSNEKFKEALQDFERVAIDDELKDSDNPLEVSIKERTVKNNVRRETLIDSVRAYTEVYKKDPDPVGYYSRIIPTETLFQETIEKLAYRYIFLKNELQAMKLLRVLSERVTDPQKIVNTYREVLSIIPPIERIEVPPSEMRYVMSKYSAWSNNFEIPEQTKKDAKIFFETQIREMGTKAHDLAKSELSQTRKEVLYERAHQFYLIYLGYFSQSKYASRIATDLADVYYFQKNYLLSGDLYLRIYQGEFGKNDEKEALLQNAILCLQKKGPSDFYEIIRTRGLLLRAINAYMQFNPKKKNDPQLNFALAKGVYEQGLYSSALPQLVKFVQRFPKAQTESEAAVDLILDYFNTRSDFKGLTAWSEKLLAIKTLSPALRTRLNGVKSKAVMKQVDDKVKSTAGYDPFAQGKIYFEAALNLHDEALRSAALEQALARSKAEKDINTFLKVARTIAGSEKNADKKAQILSATGDQTLAIGRFYQTIDLWREVMNMGGVSKAMQQRIREKIAQLTLMLKNFRQMTSIAKDVNATLSQSINSQLAQAMESPAIVSETDLSRINLRSLSDADLASFIKGIAKTQAVMQNTIMREASGRCRSGNHGALCKWVSSVSAHKILTDFANTVHAMPPKLENIEGAAKAFAAFLEKSKEMTETGDPALDIFGSLHVSQGYTEFAQYLNRAATANPAAAAPLKAKATESLQAGQQEKNKCGKIINASALISPINRLCVTGTAGSFAQSFTWSKLVTDTSKQDTDPHSTAVDDLQKKLFSDSSKPDNFLDLAAVYFTQGNYHHAIALADYGSSTFSGSKDEFNTIKGCGLVKLGLFNEAQFALKTATDTHNLKAGCVNELKEKSK